MNTKIYDMVGIGIGPFNLGLAALSDRLPIKTLFFEQLPAFDWHRGLLIEGSTLQVPFLADLVTAVAPTNPYSYINYTVKKGMLFKFCIKESFYITRTEYNDYCRWVAAQLPQLLFSHRVTGITYNETDKIYSISVHDLINRCTKKYVTRKLVLGTGMIPSVPECAVNCSRERVFHASQYTYRKPYIKPASIITVVGSGQSAAEIFQDLLSESKQRGYQLNWITRAERFFPMENSKFTFEHTSPDYLTAFFKLSESKRNRLVKNQDVLYKGINPSLMDAIYDELYKMQLYQDPPKLRILPSTKLIAAEGTLKDGYDLSLFHELQEEIFKMHSDYIILATGYRYEEPTWLSDINNRIKRNKKGTFSVAANFSVDINENEIYVLNAELTSHGILTSDLGMGPYRNAVILNDILEVTYFTLEKKIAFQQFDIPDDLKSNEGY